MHSLVFNEDGKIIKCTVGYAMDRVSPIGCALVIVVLGYWKYWRSRWNVWSFVGNWSCIAFSRSTSLSEVLAI